MISSIRHIIANSATNFNGFRTKKKIVVFESDDWGAIRLPDKSLYAAYINAFPEYASNPYLKYDSLASETDLTNLFHVLNQYKDKRGKCPIFTFNVVMTNPDFEKIKASNFQNYYNEPFSKTLQRFSQHTHSFDLWKKAINEKLMQPQFHGREHVNVPMWFKVLKEENSDVRKAFDFQTWSTPKGTFEGINLQAALDWKLLQPMEYQEQFLEEGLKEFKSVFGFSSDTIIPNNYIFDPNLYPTLVQNGVKGMQGMKYQKLALGTSDSGNRKMIRRSLGSKNEAGLSYLVRNCAFEPSQTKSNYDDVDFCLKSISNAFLLNKPAIIDTHRLNYIGVYDEKNRDQNLKKLSVLIKSILSKWEDVEFMTSDQLLKEII